MPRLPRLGGLMGFNYPVPAAEGRVEMRVSNSLFIASAARADTVEEAKSFVRRVRQEHTKATHNVYAFVAGHGASVTEGCHDDGEPGGTAGRPVLAVLRGSGLGDTVVVVTRYFGGTKLGTGGLVRAYGDAARAVLEAIPRVQKVERREVVITFPYRHYEQVKRLIELFEGQAAGEEFSADVLLQVILVEDAAEPFLRVVSESTGGRVVVRANHLLS
jgi:uncharacterized YigZ family protein